MKKWDKGKFWTKNRDCPSKSRTIGEYENHPIPYNININGCMMFKNLLDLSSYTIIIEFPVENSCHVFCLPVAVPVGMVLR